MSAAVAPNEACERKRTAPASSGIVAWVVATVLELVFSPPPQAANSTAMADASIKLRAVIRSVFIPILTVARRFFSLSSNVADIPGCDGVRRLGSVFMRVHTANDLPSQRASCERENFHVDRGKRSLIYSLILAVALVVATRPAVGREELAGATLPSALRESMRSTGLPASAFAIVVRPLGQGGLRVAFNDTVAMRPASTMKLVTTYAALDLLGPAFRWRTEAFTASALHDDTLEGDLVIRGSGDPRLVLENLWSLVQGIRAYGVREIRGDVVLDRSAFEPLLHDPALFDGEPLRPYNTGPDPLLLNFKTLSFGFMPEPDTRTVRLVVGPPLAGAKWPSTVTAADG